MPINIHSTADPRVFFAGGDIFCEESMSRFDGLLCYAYSGRPPELELAAEEFRRNNAGALPCIIHGRPESAPPISRLKSLIHKDLDALATEGCRRIGIAGSKVSDADYIDGAKESVRAIVDWLDGNPGTVDSITLVDVDDDYYRRLGRDPFRTGALIHNPSPTPFERWFEAEFPETLALRFNIDRRCEGLSFRPDCIFFDPDSDPKHFGQLMACPDAYLSVAMFYTTLLPLATANEAEMIDGMYAFAKCTGWPCFDRVIYGYISPCSVLEVTGLLPEPGNADDWIRLAESEAGYFGAIVDTLIEGRIFFKSPANASPLDDPELFLHGMHGRLKHRVLDRIQAHLAETVAYLRGNGQKPDVDYLRRNVYYENLLLDE